MTAHNNQEESYHITYAFDELDNNCKSTMNNNNTTCQQQQRQGTAATDQSEISTPFDEQQINDMPLVTPISPCSSDASTATMSVTGQYRNIEYSYHVDTKVLGTGHHGSVRQCINRTNGQKYAVKSIRKNDPAVKPGGLAREIMLLKEMKHQSIIQLVDVFEDAEYIHLVTDLCEGGELFDKIVEKSSADNGVPCFEEHEAASIMLQILNAVSYMHNRGIVHRDIKPENILFDSKDTDSPIKLIDLGLARKHYGIEPPMTTVVGTPYYIAPDVLKKSYDKSCDLWSVGVIAYILLCGYPPMNGANNSEVYEAVRRGRYRFPSSEWVHTSRESRDFIRKLLQKDPSKRMTAEEALNHPWILKHTVVEDDRMDDTSVEVVFHEERDRRDSILVPAFPASPKATKSKTRRRSPMSMFAVSL